MPTLRRRSLREDISVVSAAAGRPVLLATLDVPFAEDAAAFAVDSAVETGQPLVVVNAVEVPPTPWTLVGYGYIERDDLQNELRKPAELACSLAVRVERLRLCSPHPIEALLEIVAERDPGLLVFGPDRSRLKPRTYRRAAKKILAHVTCLVWFAGMD
jgi:nucleotide-binding universal stress UspA family protein